MGGIATLTNTDVNQEITINVEYNQLEPLLKATWNKDGDIPDENGYSYFPGNTNVIVIKVESYLDTLDKTQGLIPEFVNPKYKDESKDVFKSATRLECMMQDYPKLLNKNFKVGFSCYERWFCFSAVKNNIVDAAGKFKKGLHPECGATGEYDLFEANSILLKMIGVDIEDAGEEDIKDYQGIELKDGAKVFIHPSFGVTMREIQDKFSGVNKISKNSILWLQGENTHIKDLDLDSTLVTNEKTLEITGEFKEQAFVKYQPLSTSDANFEDLDEVIKIRGFRVTSSNEVKGLKIIS